MHKTKAFETYTVSLSPGSKTETLLHPTKTKMIHVTSGILCLQSSVKNTNNTHSVVAGKFLEIPAGTTHVASNESTRMVEFVVVQESKFDARVETLKPEVLVEPRQQEVEIPVGVELSPVFVPRERNNKAVQQMADHARSRGRGAPPPRAATSGGTKGGINAMPMDVGSFSEEGAG